jgi:hypothetical protein
VSGNLLWPDYEGMRTGRWARTSRVQVVQYAIPVELEPRGEEEIVEHLTRRLVEAVDLAEHRLAKARNRLPVRQARVIVDRLAVE